MSKSNKKRNARYGAFAFLAVLASCTTGCNDVIPWQYQDEGPKKSVCPDGLIKVNDICVDPGRVCGGYICQGTEVCLNEACVAADKVCNGVACLSNQSCVENQCIDSSRICPDKICESSEMCRNGACVPAELCGESACTEDQTCVDSSGVKSCIERERICENGNICSESESCLVIVNECMETKRICENETVCGVDETCKENACIDDDKLCGDKICTDSQTCVASVEGGTPDTCVEDKRVCEDGTVCDETEICESNNCIEEDKICKDDVCEADETCVASTAGGDPDTCINDKQICENGTFCEVTQTCISDNCVEDDKICGDKICSAEETCVDSENGKTCVDTDRVCENGTICAENENCVNNACTDTKRICEDDTVCAADETCKDNNCIKDDKICGDNICTDLQTCVASIEGGEPDTCIDTDRICENGTICSETQVCKDNSCVEEDKVCKDDVCEADETCVASVAGGDPDTCVNNKQICENGTVCEANQTCISNNCVDDEKICKDDICIESETCFNDVCEPTDKICGDEGSQIVCTAEQTCFNKICEPTDKICGDEGNQTVCTADQVCIDKTCYDTSDTCESNSKICADTQVCLDDKCTDKTDTCEDFSVICSSDEVCIEDSCVDKTDTCQGNSVVCPSNQVCINDTCTNKDDTCENNTKVCADTQVCLDDKCTDKTDTCEDFSVICSSNEVCIEDSCVDKTDTCQNNTVVCPSNQVCINDTCTNKDDTCENNTKVCTSNQHCIDDECINDSDSCVDHTVVCPTGTQCFDNKCEDISKICGDVLCAEGETCFKDACVDDDKICGEIVCGATEQCVGDPKKCIDESRICGDDICELSEVCFTQSNSSKVCVDPDKICGEDGSQVVCSSTEVCFNNACVNPDDICGSTVCSAETECFKYSDPNQCVEPEKICDEDLCEDSEDCVAASKVSAEEAGTLDNLCVDSKRVCDDGSVCAASQTCIDDTCVDDEKVCEDDICEANETCFDDVNDDKGKICVITDSICDKTTCDLSIQVCADKVCKPKCYNTCVAEDHQTCEETTGECRNLYVCEGIACKDDETCASTADYPYGECIETACAVDYTATAPVCAVSNTCYAEMTCAIEGQVCYGGTCMDDGCQGKVCDTGWQCIKGECEETACIGISCPSGRACSGGKCIDLECLPVDEHTCPSGQTCAMGDCIYDACLDTNGHEITCNQGKICVETGDCAFETAPTLSVTLDGSKTDENGKSIAATLKIDHEPVSNITVTCEVLDNSAEVSVDCSSILFNATNYKDAQYVTIKGVADNIVDGDKSYRIKFTTVSDETDFNGLTFTTETLTNADVDVAGITPNVTSIETYEKDQNEVSFVLNFSSKPTSDVTVKVASSNTNEGKVIVPASGSVTMSPDDWKSGITVTVKGIDDNSQDGSQEYNISFEVTSSDSNYNGIAVATVKGTNYDDDKAGLNVTERTLETSESGKTDSFDISLATQPSDNVSVTISIVADNTGVDITHEASLTPTSFTINADEWKTARTVVVTGLPDEVPVIDGDQPYTITIALDSADSNYRMSKTISGVNKDMDTADFVLPNMGTTNVDETGKSITGSVKLSSKPTGTVNVSVTSANTSEVAVSPATLVFDSTNWDIAQQVTFTGVADSVVDENKPVTVTLGVTSSEDDNFASATASWTITNLNKDVANVSVTPSSTTVKEAETGTVLVKLTSKPSSPVTITPKSSSTSIMTVSPASIVLDSTNWNTGATLTVSGVHDGSANLGGSRSANLNFTFETDDANYKNVTVNPIAYSITDIDSAVLTITPDASTVSPVDDNDTQSTGFKVSLSTKPENNVTVSLSLTDSTGSASLGQANVTFTPTNWADVNVSVAIDTTLLTSAETSYTINGSISGSSTAYDGKTASGSFIYIALPMDDSGDYSSEYIVEGSGEMDESACTDGKKLLVGTYKLEVWGASGGDGVNNDQSKKSHGGLGGYSVGYLTVTEPIEYYVHFGTAGFAGRNGKSVGGGCNAGGDGTTQNSTHVGYGGGGSSDIRLDGDTLYHRVIVAGGGGGAGTGAGGNDDGSGGVGGGTNGGYGRIDGKHYAEYIYYANGATQTSGYRFGSGECHDPGIFSFAAGGGGAGWFGGYAVGDLLDQHDAGGGGGSGFVLTSATRTSVINNVYDLRNNYKLKDSKYYLTNAETKAGTETFPSPNGGSETGHKGNGYVRITLVQ